AGEATFINKVHDQLELVHRLEERRLGLVARLDERLERRLDQGADAAAEDDLLAEEVGLGLFEEGGLQYAGAGAADALGVSERVGVGLTGVILEDGDQAGHAGALDEDFAHAGAGRLGGDHAHVDEAGRDDLVEI